MHHCNNEDVISFYRIKHRVWENMDKASPYVLEETPACRSLGDLSKSRFNTRDKPDFKTSLDTGVVTSRGLIFIESLQVELHSSRDSAPHTGKTFITRNGFDAPAAHIVAPA